MVIGGGGQDSGQKIVQNDLQNIAPQLKAWAEKDTPMLMICGLYQLFGNFFEMTDGSRIKGVGILDVETYARNERLIGNIITRSDDFGVVVGYENHSGQTFLGPDATPLATVSVGVGNNTRDAHEGARYKNVIGSYLHGSILPKNPKIADWIIKTAATNKFGEFTPQKIDDSITKQARRIAMKRPR